MYYLVEVYRHQDGYSAKICNVETRDVSSMDRRYLGIIQKEVLAAGNHVDDPAQAILLAAKQLAGEDTTPWHTPGQPQKNCVLCGETMYQDRYDVWCDARTGNPVEIAEMHGALKPMYGTADIQVSDGFCHAQCGINAGWEVS